MDARDAIRTVSKVAGRAFVLKAAVIGFALFFIFLLIVGMFGAGGQDAFASSCGKRGMPEAEDTSSDGQAANGSTRKEQIANAKIIDEVAKKYGLPGKATLMALIISLQESGLINLDHGDRDSVGLFQQRPSSGWGTKEQIMDPRYAAKMFFMGGDSGDPPGLTDQQGWESMSIRTIVTKVQRPDDRYLDLYAGHEGTARAIAHEAGIDLDRGGNPTGNKQRKGQDKNEGDNSSAQNASQECHPDGAPSLPNGALDMGRQGDGGTLGSPFHDGHASWPSDVKNPRSTAEAIAWAKHEATSGGNDWYRACLAFVARTYGWNFSGVALAIEHYRQMPASMKHDHDRNPPPGALMYWETGSPAGHVAIYLGDGKIASNDILRPGYIDVVDADLPETKWGAKYQGWAPPYFPQGG